MSVLILRLHQLTDEQSVRHLPSKEPHRHLVRLGWSQNHTSLMLGEEKNSFAFCGTGKKVTNQTAEDYGEEFKGGDVICSYLVSREVFRCYKAVFHLRFKRLR